MLVFTLLALLLGACKKSEMSIPASSIPETKPADKPAGSKNKITIDFTAISDQRAVVTITGTNGEGTFVFNSVDGTIQTGSIPRKSTYEVKWEYYAVTPVACNYMLYWNYTGISIYGTYPYNFISTCCVTFEKDAVFTFYKDCGS